MFAIRYCSDIASHTYDFKVFETVEAARQWYRYYIGPGALPFIDMLYVLPPGLKDPIQWCKDNIKELEVA